MNSPERAYQTAITIFGCLKGKGKDKGSTVPALDEMVALIIEAIEKAVEGGRAIEEQLAPVEQGAIDITLPSYISEIKPPGQSQDKQDGGLLDALALAEEI